MTRPRRVRGLTRSASASGRGVLLVVAVVGALASGGCRGGAAAAPPSAPDVVAPAGSADPLDSVDRRLDGIEKQVDRDGAG